MGRGGRWERVVKGKRQGERGGDGEGGIGKKGEREEMSDGKKY